MTFTFASFPNRTPVRTEDDSIASCHASAEVRQTIQRIQAKKLRILVVEDHPDHRDLMVRILSKTYGATVTPFETAEPALNWLQSDDSFHLILLDIVLPGISGIDACQELRGRKTRARIALMTAGNDPTYAKHAETLGAPLLQKPIDSDELRQLLLECGEADS